MASSSRGWQHELPLESVPLFLQILSSPNHASRDESLELLCELVGSAFGEEGDALGACVRDAGGLATLSWLLAEAEPGVRKQALFLISNLASDCVDRASRHSKRQLLRCGTAYRLLPCLDADDGELVAYACAALQNLSQDPEWSQLLLKEGAVKQLEEIATEPSNALAQRYAAGALKNLMAALHRAGFDASASIVGDAAREAVRERATPAALARIPERVAARTIPGAFLQSAWLRRHRLEAQERQRPREGAEAASLEHPARKGGGGGRRGKAGGAGRRPSKPFRRGAQRGGRRL